MSAFATWFDGLPVGAQVLIAMQISFAIGWGFGFATGRRRPIKEEDR